VSQKSRITLSISGDAGLLGRTVYKG